MRGRYPLVATLLTACLLATTPTAHGRGGDAAHGRPTPTPNHSHTPPHPRPTPHHVPTPRPTPTSPPDYCAPFRAAAVAPKGHLQWARPPHMVVTTRHSYTLTVTTYIPRDKGRHSFIIALATGTAPATVNSVLFLACNGYYTGSVFNRVIAGRLVEGGSPLNGTGPGYAEHSEKLRGGYARGTVAMVDDGSATDGGRFFILLDRISLPGVYTILGTVSSGIATLDRISRVPVTLQPDAQEPSLPIQPPRITAVALTVR